MNSLRISVLAIIAEAFLLVLGVLWIKYRALEYNISSNFHALKLSIVFTICLLIFNAAVFTASKYSDHLHAIFKDFFNTWIKPLCLSLSLPGILIVAITSGIGEEVFFRAALNTELSNFLGPELGLLLGSVLFAYMHFLKLTKELLPVFILYVFVGMAFSLIYYCTDNLFIPILTHSIYNFSVISFVKLQIKLKN